MRGNVKSPVCQSPSLHWVDCVTHKPTGRPPSSLLLSFFFFFLLHSPCLTSFIFLSHMPLFSRTISGVYTHVHTQTHTHTHTHVSEIESNTDPQWKSTVKKHFFAVFQLLRKISLVSFRSSLATGSVTPLTPAMMDALPLSPPREVWEMDSSSCWTFSRMNTCPSGEKQVRGTSFTSFSGWQIWWSVTLLTACVGRCVVGLCAGGRWC